MKRSFSLIYFSHISTRKLHLMAFSLFLCFTGHENLVCHSIFSFGLDIYIHEMYHLLNPKMKPARRGEVPWRPMQRAMVLEPCVVLHASWRTAVERVAELYIASAPNFLHTQPRKCLAILLLHMWIETPRRK